jgi:uncharacterized protein YjbI with pentapeptide repeats
VNVNFTEARLYSADVDQATMSDIILTDADVFNTAISVGGEYP